MGKIAEFFKKLKNVRHIEILACGAILAVVLAVYFSFVSCSADKTKTASLDLSDMDYCTAMQTQLEKIVSEISGVGDASVVVNWDRSVGGSLMGATTENPKATGAIIVCAGGNDAKVKVDVIFAVATLLDLSIDKIMVYPKSI